MSIFQAVVLGIVQGLTEFLPVSSTGHLIIFPLLLKWPLPPLVFDTTLHLATATSLIVFFYKDLVELARALVGDLVKNNFRFKNYSPKSLTGLAIVVGCIPAGVLGFLAGDFIENIFRSMVWVAVFLILGSVLIYIAERFALVHKNSQLAEQVSPKKGFFIGLFQSIALLPGISRSGSTISGGLFFGLDRQSAVKFSFLLSIPIVLVAGLSQLVFSFDKMEALPPMAIVAGFISGFVSGLFAIKFLLGFVKTNSFKVFIIYRVLLAIFLLISFYTTVL
ncbi:MAG: undecaprenyl-diphosphatase UppP [uncultured bacterium]|nr:MAG: undecaprenyl-diphosphatase UppP [uncultured bacterium]